MSKKGGLGKGLGAIFGENPSPVPEAPQEPAKAEGAAEEVLIKKITANPYQPRRVFDEEKLEELAASIKEFGVVHLGSSVQYGGAGIGLNAYILIGGDGHIAVRARQQDVGELLFAAHIRHGCVPPSLRCRPR